MPGRATAPRTVAPSTSLPIEDLAHRAQATRALATVVGDRVSDLRSGPDDHDHREDRILTLETVVVILCVVAGLIAFAVGAF